jgi:hypothetical protein
VAAGAGFDSARSTGESHNGSTAFVEVELASDDGDLPLSDAAEDLDGHVRRLISDLSDFDVRDDGRKRSSDLTKRFYLAAFLLVALFLLVGVEVVATGSGSSDTAATAASGNAASTNSNSERTP